MKVILALILAIMFVPMTAEAQTQSSQRSMNKAMLDELNEIRVENDAEPLRFNPELNKCAKVRAEEISEYFSHTRPDGSWFDTVSFETHGENVLSTRLRHTPEEIFGMWLESQAHTELMLDKSYATVGIAKYTDGDIDYWVLEFGY